jgi:predicted flap endonuclease-1-like 5' DNA nuclease
VKAQLEEAQRARDALAQSLSERDSEHAWALAERDHAIARVAQELEGRTQELARVEQELARAHAHEPTQRPDDLKVLKGIGPKFENALHAAGIVHIAQIAAWSEADVEEIAQKLGVRAERIRRDGWVEAAKSLIAGSAG